MGARTAAAVATMVVEIEPTVEVTGSTVAEAAGMLQEFLPTVAGRMQVPVVAAMRAAHGTTVERATTDLTATGPFGREAS